MSVIFKIVLVGDTDVGKTSLTSKILTNRFHESSYPTIGVNFSCKTFHISNSEDPIKLHVWDTAGMERFRSISPLYYRNSSAIFLVYDISNRKSFENIKSYWINEINIDENKFLKVYLIGNKTDMIHNRKVSFLDGSELAKQYGLCFYELSSKKDNVDIFIDKVINELYEIVKTKIPEHTLHLYGITIDKKYNYMKCCPIS